MNLELSLIENEMEKISSEFNLQRPNQNNGVRGGSHNLMQQPYHHHHSQGRFREIKPDDLIIRGGGGINSGSGPMMITSNQDNSLTNSVNLILPTVPPLLLNSEHQPGLMQPTNQFINNNLSSNLSGGSSSQLGNDDDGDSQNGDLMDRSFQNQIVSPSIN